MIHRMFRLVADKVITTLAIQGCRGRSAAKIPDTVEGPGPAITGLVQGSKHQSDNNNSNGYKKNNNHNNKSKNKKEER